MAYLTETISRKVAHKVLDQCSEEHLKKIGYFSDPVAIARGVNLVMMNLISWSIIGLIGIKIGVLSFSVAYMITYLLLRYRFGGSHFHNPYICLGVSTVLPLVGGWIARTHNLPVYTFIIIGLFAVYSAFSNKVKDNPNYAKFNPDKKALRQALFFKQGLALLVVITIAQLVLVFLGMENYAEAMLMGELVLFINLWF